MLERILFAIGYLIAPVLFFRASTPRSVVKRLRFAYRLAGVRIKNTERVDATERTVFLCPYRNLFADRYGARWVCHEKLDRVDDGYVAYLRRFKNIDYQRPQGCAEAMTCYSEVSDL